ncbi:MAG: hypothetical protein MJ116_11410, partial [Lachnospiraceae bacterium]|nr:hypothetical protein [Lachnospiraceae bacterium]
SAEGQPAEGQPAEGQPAEGQPAEGQPAEDQPLLDTEIPAPPEGIPDESVINGGNDLFSEGIPNGQ